MEIGVEAMEGIATKKLETLQTQVIEWRRYLHANPELSFEEVETPAFIVQKLKEIGFTDIREHVGGRGVVAKLHGKSQDRQSLFVLILTHCRFMKKMMFLMHRRSQALCTLVGMMATQLLC